MNMNTNMFYVYLLVSSDNATYVGATVDLERRLRQHNKEIKGGAHATGAKVAKGETWVRAAHVSGFPYGVAKLYSHWITKNYRESYGMFACSGILFNHESPRRGHNFVTRKITIALGNIVKGTQDKLVLGNINSLRDWGHAKDYVNGMYLMLQQENPDDFILSTNEYHTVREFIERSFALKGYNIKWKGEGVNEIGYDENTGKELIFISDKYFRPSEVEELLGDNTKAKKELGWTSKYTFDELVREMVENDCK